MSEMTELGKVLDAPLCYSDAEKLKEAICDEFMRVCSIMEDLQERMDKFDTAIEMCHLDDINYVVGQGFVPGSVWRFRRTGDPEPFTIRFVSYLPFGLMQFQHLDGEHKGKDVKCSVEQVCRNIACFAKVEACRPDAPRQGGMVQTQTLGEQA